ncbi:DUF2235 domain-containing protein [Arthrobacter sp. RIT-PI-e]|uniref:DUF2235 domain-containing protein n=1 Tax=Arthrobacter sp. RIT-PI-e TaxID=1681197 RepID=UPI000675E0CA|nr:DUF2235 domain-containing protein [Arthrobacter sp. RIT-PI-e]
MDIALFLDGTWQDRDDFTNIVQLWERTPAAGTAGAPQETYYDPGVGTGHGLLERLLGGAFGYGLDRHIIDAYRFIADHHHSDDDRIYLLGFSRGAFTARSLGGVIAKCGIIAPEILSAEAVFARYRRGGDAPGLREMQAGEEPATTAQDRLLLERSRLVRIRFIGVLDTVGSLGIPGGLGHWLSRRRYAFHDTALSGLVDHACHAVAIDEHRAQFTPTLWSGVPIPVGDHVTHVEQRWFVGAHSSIGGGGTSRPSIDNPLSVLTREWIAGRAAQAGLVLRLPVVPVEGDEWRGPIRAPRTLGGLLRLLPGRKPRLRPVRTSTGETIDGSVLRRWGTGAPPYRPGNPNLAAWVRELTGR